MGMRGGLLFLLVLSVEWFYVDARSLATSDASIMQINTKGSKSENEASQADLRNDKVCTLCEQFTEQAIYYLGENKTQTEIIETLHVACYKMHSFRQQCITLVDYYAPLFFLEIALVEPENFCSKVNLCNEMMLTSPNSCSLCHEAVAEILNKLEDPDTQLEIIELLLKACDAAENYAKKCKKLVFEYGPLILANAQKFLEKKDFCATIHACKASPNGSEAEASSAEISLLSES